jgi:hypothetical protein
VGLNTVLLWAHLHGNEPFNLVSSRDDDGDEGGGGGGSDSDSDSEEATPDVLMLKVSTSMSKTRPVCGRPQRRPQVVGRGWPEPEAARGVIWRRKKSPERQLHG